MRDLLALLGELFDVCWFSIMVLISVGSVGGFFYAWYHLLRYALGVL